MCVCVCVRGEDWVDLVQRDDIRGNVRNMSRDPYGSSFSLMSTQAR